MSGGWQSFERPPYVGAGANGARRSAEIDRTEAESLARGDERRDECLLSAERWIMQAERLEQAERDAVRRHDRNRGEL